MGAPVKTKLSYPVSSDQAKDQLRIPAGDDRDKNYIKRLIKVATEEAEDYIGKDISNTLNVIERYDWPGGDIKIPAGNYRETVSVITDASVALTVEYDDIFNTYAFIKIAESNSADPLTITYYTGFEDDKAPEKLKQAILIKVSDLYDKARNSHPDKKDSGLFEKMIRSYYKNSF